MSEYKKKKSTKKITSKPPIKKDSSKSSIKKTVIAKPQKDTGSSSGVIKKKRGSSLFFKVAAPLASAALLYGLFALKKKHDFNKEYSEISINIKDEKEAIKVAFDPKINGEWKGETALQMLYLKEYLLKKFNNSCTVDNNISRIMFYLEDGEVNGVTIMKGELVYLMNRDKSEFFGSQINFCDKRFVIIPILIMVAPGVFHNNILIVDKKNNTVEHFEPHGASYSKISSIFNNENIIKKLYIELKTTFGKIGYTYLSPNQSCPLIGPQMLEELVLCSELMIPQFKNKIGMCMIWSLFYAQLRLTYPERDSIELINSSIKSLGTDLCKFIKGYAQTVLAMSKKYNLIVDKQSGAVMGYTEK